MSRTISYIFGAIMTIAGLWGILASNTLVLWFFQANMALSVVWLILGLVLLAVALWWKDSLPLVLKIYGIVTAIIAIWGFVVPGDVFGLLTNTTADNVLHLIFAVVFLWFGFMGDTQKDMVQPIV